uniref:Uncharacterized protein n=1 Tax=Euplotes harpa TaxID=151035 RepID=A0A7S3JMY0_9SPIT|mmetsp:Transcript_9891/g.11108  ORF Transcript_9891/g.11108 Transcript_9891/m.11108 type:complete len:153 (+) Transcript_9891:258-716(+)
MRISTIVPSITAMISSLVQYSSIIGLFNKNIIKVADKEKTKDKITFTVAKVLALFGYPAPRLFPICEHEDIDNPKDTSMITVWMLLTIDDADISFGPKIIERLRMTSIEIHMIVMIRSVEIEYFKNSFAFRKMFMSKKYHWARLISSSCRKA